MKGLDNRDFPIPVKFYNVETKELLKTTVSLSEASDYSGLSVGSVMNHIKRKTKSKPEKNKLGLTLCFR